MNAVDERETRIKTIAVLYRQLGEQALRGAADADDNIMSVVSRAREAGATRQQASVILTKRFETLASVVAAIGVDFQDIIKIYLPYFPDSKVETAGSESIASTEEQAPIKSLAPVTITVTLNLAFDTARERGLFPVPPACDPPDDLASAPIPLETEWVDHAADFFSAWEAAMTSTDIYTRPIGAAIQQKTEAAEKLARIDSLSGELLDESTLAAMKQETATLSSQAEGIKSQLLSATSPILFGRDRFKAWKERQKEELERVALRIAQLNQDFIRHKKKADELEPLKREAPRLRDLLASIEAANAVPAADRSSAIESIEEIERGVVSGYASLLVFPLELLADKRRREQRLAICSLGTSGYMKKIFCGGASPRFHKKLVVWHAELFRDAVDCLSGLLGTIGADEIVEDRELRGYVQNISDPFVDMMRATDLETVTSIPRFCTAAAAICLTSSISHMPFGRFWSAAGSAAILAKIGRENDRAESQRLQAIEEKATELLCKLSPSLSSNPSEIRASLKNAYLDSTLQYTIGNRVI